MQQLAPRTMPPMSQEHATTDTLLRDHVGSANSLPPPYSAADNMQSDTASPIDPHDHDTEHGMDVDGPDGRKAYGKRELSTSKRAAQNRAAQRAFRQRKEGYIKKLEEQVRDYSNLSESYKSLQQENYQLRDYIIKLQSRLLEMQGEVPPPPSNLNGLEPEHCNKPRPPPSQLPQPNQLGPHQVGGPGTLPRLSELGAVSSQPGLGGPLSGPQKDLNSAQAALQGPSILQNHPQR